MMNKISSVQYSQDSTLPFHPLPYSLHCNPSPGGGSGMLLPMAKDLAAFLGMVMRVY